MVYNIVIAVMDSVLRRFLRNKDYNTHIKHNNNIFQNPLKIRISFHNPKDSSLDNMVLGGRGHWTLPSTQSSQSAFLHLLFLKVWVLL